MSTEKAPYVSAELLAYLEKHYPDRCPDPCEVNLTDRKIWAAAGQAQLVRKLRHLYQAQTRRALEGT